jgi:recombination protein RecT
MNPQQNEVSRRTGNVPAMQQVVDGLDQRSNHIAAIVPSGIDKERLRYVCLQAVKKNPDLLKCRPATIIAAIVQAFEIGLEPNTPKKQAYLIPYKDECQFQPSYIGLVTVARRGGELKKLYAREVRKNDTFDVRYGTDEGITHIPAKENRGELVASYAVATMANGETDFEVMFRDDINAVRKMSKASHSPWDGWEGEMSKKAVIKRLCKRLPMDDVYSRAIEIDNEAEILQVMPMQAETEVRLNALADRLTAAKEDPAVTQADPAEEIV